jgi:hypothetical protein
VAGRASEHNTSYFWFRQSASAIKFGQRFGSAGGFPALDNNDGSMQL